MDHPMTEEESYADRRQLFKNIWDTALTIDKNDEKKEGNGLNKPKVIRTLRLDEVKRCIVEKKKEKRLRVVCNKILDICGQQDTDNMLYSQMAADHRKYPMRKKVHRMRKKSKVTKIGKAKKSLSIFTQIQDVLQSGTMSPYTFLKLNKFSENSSITKIKRPTESVQKNYRKKEIYNRVKQFPGAKILTRETPKYSIKRLFPINKVNIN